MKTERVSVVGELARAGLLALIALLVSCAHGRAAGYVYTPDATQRRCETKADCVVANARSCDDCIDEPFPISRSAEAARIHLCSIQDYNPGVCGPPPVGKLEDFRAECEDHLCVLAPRSR